MSIILFPVNLPVAKHSWLQQRNDVEFRSMFGAQAVEGSGPLWAATASAPDDLESVAGPWQALILQLRGRVNQLAMFNIGRPVPRGSMRGAMTLVSPTALGATSFTITAAGQAGRTLVQGDYLGFGSGLTQQVVMVLVDAVADGNGSISVVAEPPLRTAFLAGDVVLWDHPRALFRRNASTTQTDYEGALASGMALDMLEDPRP